MRGDLLVVGQLSLDDLRSEYGEVRGQPGGAALYVAVAAALQGCTVTLAAAAGKDYPDLASLSLPDNVRFRGVRVKSDRSTRVRINRRGGQMIEWSIDYESGYVWPDELGNHCMPRHIHLCAMPSALIYAWKALAVRLAVPFSLGLASGFGPQERLNQLSRAEARRLVDGAELVFCNAWEAKMVTATAEMPELATRLVEMGANSAIVTNGASACNYASRAGRTFECPVRSAARVVDTTGAGDSLAGSVLGAKLMGFDYHASLEIGIDCALSVIGDFGMDALFEAVKSRGEQSS